MSRLQLQSDKLGLGQVGPVQAQSKLFIILHGSFMIAAWVCAASLGIMMARYTGQSFFSFYPTYI